MRVRILAFAALREAIEDASCWLDLAPGARVREAWAELAHRYPQLDAFARSTRIARNGELAQLDDPLTDGDELALLPPVGGG